MHVAEIVVDTITDLKKTRIGQCLEACGPGQVTLEDEHQNSKLSGTTHAATKTSIISDKNGKETRNVKHTILGTNSICFKAKDPEKIMAPHHDVMVVSLTMANCLLKRILVENRNSNNIMFLDAYNDIGLEKDAMTWKVMPLIGFSGKVKQKIGEVVLLVYAEGVNMSTKFLVIECASS
ncbi:hypothetical protein F2Q68_00026620 [Brassica cretica]|uniref:Uncharacterized protein n=1 Tax=Brassica cretica TaxID=69181 RepID=A0A8S9IHF2_BRACR|nr:hypothetical protein F2Q68_00026620 [Brassica cretica]